MKVLFALYRIAIHIPHLMQTNEDKPVGGSTVVTDKKWMSSKWESHGSQLATRKAVNVGKLVDAGGPDYWIGGDNCQDAVRKMFNAAGL